MIILKYILDSFLEVYRFTYGNIGFSLYFIKNLF